MKLALFDFDGTLCKTDSFTGFFRFAFSKAYFYRKCLPISAQIGAYYLAQYPANLMRPTLYHALFKDQPYHNFEAKIDAFATQILNQLNPVVLARLKWHQHQQHQIYIVSAGLDLYLNPICKRLEIPLICTQVELQNGQLTGQYLTADCSHQQKVQRVLDEIDLTHYDEIYAYGNSSEDYPMLRLAQHAYWVDRSHQLHPLKSNL